MAAYLTGSQPGKNISNGLQVGISADQVIAEKVGYMTKFPSLEIGCEEGQAGRQLRQRLCLCRITRTSPGGMKTTPLVKDCNPQSVFDRLFGNGEAGETEEAKAKRKARRKSVLDFVLDDAKGLQNQMGSSDKRKVDEYMSTIREIEVRLNRTEPQTPIPRRRSRPPDMDRSSGEFPVHCKLMIDMMVLAFQADLTRVITFPFTNELRRRNIRGAMRT